MSHCSAGGKEAVCVIQGVKRGPLPDCCTNSSAVSACREDEPSDFKTEHTGVNIVQTYFVGG